MSNNLSRPAFYFLHLALVRKCDDILQKKYGQGLNRGNAQLFYGYQDGNGEVRSINEVLQSTLVAKAYNLAPFRNFSINGRRLNDNVKRYNDQYETIPVHDAYLAAYLSFLEVEAVEQLIEPDIDPPSRIDFGGMAARQSRSAFPDKKRIKIMLEATAVLIVILIFFKACCNPTIEKSKISSPVNGQEVAPVIECSGILAELKEGYTPILVVERDSIIEQNGQPRRIVKYWYKEHLAIKGPKWDVTIFENYGGGDYSKTFSIALYAVDSAGIQVMKQWIRTCKETGTYYPEPGVGGNAIPLARVQELTVKK